MSYKDILSRVDRNVIARTLYWLLFNGFALGFPIILTSILTYSSKGSFDFITPVSHGELTLFSLSLLCSGFLILIKGIRVTGNDQIERDDKSSTFEKLRQKVVNLSFPGSPWLYGLSFIVTCSSIGFFCGISTLNPDLPNILQVKEFYLRASRFVLIASFIITLLINFIDAALDNSQYKVETIFHNSNDKYQDQFKKLDLEG